MRLPIISHHTPSPSNSQLKIAEQLARTLRTEKWRLKRIEQFNAVRCRQLGDAPSLHVDDYSEIPLCGHERQAIYMQQRACLRAVAGDWVATTRPVDEEFKCYFKDQLDLGPINWIATESLMRPTYLALSCIRSRKVRRDLSHAIRRDGVRYIHPHLASFDVWELAAWLHESTRMPIQVIGPPVEVCRFANDKVEFTELVQRLLGQEFVPRTAGAYSMATLSEHVRELAKLHQYLGVKISNGIGGYGNFFVASRDVRGHSLLEIHEYLRQRFANAAMPTSGRFLVNVWETDVLKSGSVQTWIPPVGDGPPIIEGLFEQMITGEQGHFQGSHLLEAPTSTLQQIVDQAYLLTIVFQQLGYVGRCSFDFILVGESPDNCRVEYIECNGRWGGTAAPMTLVNRLFGDYVKHPSFETTRIGDPRFADMTFGEVAAEFGEELYDARTSQGQTVLFNPGRIAIQSEIEVVRWQPERPKRPDLMRRGTGVPANHEPPTGYSPTEH